MSKINLDGIEKLSYLCSMPKVKVSYVFSIEDLMAYYEGSIPGTPIFKGHRKSLPDPALEKERKNVLTVIEKYKNELLAVQEATLKYARMAAIIEPTVYIARTRDSKTDIEYMTAKTFWPMLNGDVKEVKIYIGKASDYDNDTRSERAKKEALVKMRQTLARRVEEGSL